MLTLICNPCSKKFTDSDAHCYLQDDNIPQFLHICKHQYEALNNLIQLTVTFQGVEK